MREVAPRSYDTGSEMADEYRAALLELCYHNSEELIGVGRFEGQIADRAYCRRREKL